MRFISFEIIACLFSEEDAQARAAIIAVQKEMDDADEPSFLEEEGKYRSWSFLDNCFCCKQFVAIWNPET